MTLEQYAKELVGNHRDFESFGWYEKPEDSENWCIVYTHNRDSGPLDRSNAEIIEQEMSQFEDDAISEHHGHWAVGWVDGWAIRVYGSDGAITPAFRRWFELQERMADYPVLDEEHYSQTEYDDYCESWDSWGRSEFQGELSRVYDDYPRIAEVIENLDSEVIDELRDGLSLNWEYQDDGSSGVRINVDGMVRAVDESELLSLVKANRPRYAVTLLWCGNDPGQQFLFDV